MNEAQYVVVIKALCMWRSSPRRGRELLSDPVSHQEAECEAGRCSGRAECDEKQRSTTLHDETPAETLKEKLVPPQTNVTLSHASTKTLCVMIKAFLPQAFPTLWLHLGTKTTWVRFIKRLMFRFTRNVNPSHSV